MHTSKPVMPWLAENFEEIPGAMREALRRAKSPQPALRRSGFTRRHWLAAASGGLLLASAGLIWTGQRPLPTWRVQAQWLRAGDVDPLATDASLALGDRLSLRLQSDQPLHLYVLNQGGEDVNLLFPLAGLDAVNPLASGTRTVPGSRGGAELHWQISVEAEAERFLVIASLDPLPGFEAALAARGRQAELPPEQRGTSRLVSAPGYVSLADSALADLLEQARAEAGTARLRVWTAAFPHR